MAEHVLNSLWGRVQKKHPHAMVSPADIDAVIRFFEHPPKGESSSAMTFDVAALPSSPALDDKNAIQTKKRSLVPRTKNQATYVEALRKKEMVYGIGPAGTGKTYLAVAVGVEMYEKGLIERMVFCRPAVEAGEKLGFLPGDMREKIDPYLRPIYDALYDFMGGERVEKMLERGEIEIAPLAFMRGRTLSHAWVMLDEAQNTTSAQMKMFLSRMGENSRMVITGDPSQTDLIDGQTSGLHESMNILRDIEEIAFVEFTNADVVRHKLVGKILHAYDSKNAKK
ncbi:MAG TPA: PhoH family protein [Alphaproteobacteria bacterium]|nr:PhoH family protein [Alphaproteobacteria bacterium]HNS44380.1 PhoH family protein [Alphaproteobacteria bacterium]